MYEFGGFGDYEEFCAAVELIEEFFFCDNFLFFFMRALSSILYIIYGILKKDYVMFSSAIMPLVLEICVLFLLVVSFFV